jgi:MFS family permease
MKIITRTIWILSLVSLFTDVASEMLYPVMPVYLKRIGFSILLIGVLEGVAEATAGISKGYFGKMSDNMGRRLPFVQWGYLLSALSKPMMAMLTYPAWIFGARTVDRIGKGIRTGARDAMLSDEATPETKGRVFGFHRSMDTLGAVLGPASALLFLYFYPSHYKSLFYLATIPGVVAIAFTFLLKDRKAVPKTSVIKTSYKDFFRYWKESPADYRKLVIGLLVFALFNSSDVFLLLRIKEAGWSDVSTIGVYIFYNLVYALAAWPIGILADRIGLKQIFIGGLILFALVYIGMALNTNLWIFFILFALYGIYAAATEGIAKAWISNISEKKDTGAAIGTYTGFQSICTMVASSLTGLIWYRAGALVAFGVTALVTVGVALYLIVIKARRSVH